MLKLKIIIMFLVSVFLPLSTAMAAESINSGDTAWLLVSTALVMMMTPAGLALF